MCVGCVQVGTPRAAPKAGVRAAVSYPMGESQVAPGAGELWEVLGPVQQHSSSSRVGTEPCCSD